MNLIGKIMVWIISSGIISSGSAFTALKYLSLKREFDKEKILREKEEEAMLAIAPKPS